MSANFIKSGIWSLSFMRLNNMSIDFFKSLPATSVENNSFIRPLGSLHLFVLSFERTFSRSSSDHALLRFFLQILNMDSKSSSLIFLISTRSGLIGLSRRRQINVSKYNFLVHFDPTPFYHFYLFFQLGQLVSILV